MDRFYHFFAQNKKKIFEIKIKIKMSNSILPVTNISTTHHEDRNIVDFSRVTAKSRYENYEKQEQILSDLKQHVKNNVELHYNNINTSIDGSEVKTHIGNKEIEHRGSLVSTHHGDKSKVHNGDEITITNGSMHQNHFGKAIYTQEGDFEMTQKGLFSLSTTNVENNIENAFKTNTKHLEVNVTENHNIIVGHDSNETINKNSTIHVGEDKKEKIDGNYNQEILGKKYIETNDLEIVSNKNLICQTNNDVLTKIGNNSSTVVEGNLVSIVHKNKSESINGSFHSNTGNVFSTVNGIENKTIVHDQLTTIHGNQNVNIHGNQNVNVNKNITCHSKQDLSLYADGDLTLNAPTKKLIGGYTLIDTLVLTSPNGTRWGLIVDDHGKLKTALLSDD